MPIKVQATDLHILNMRTRMPFRYGIATLTALPHLFVRVTLQIDGQTQHGIASEGLPPKWFTKYPDTHFREDLDEMLDVIQTACRFGEEAGEASTVFELWQEIYRAQQNWAETTTYPPLLWSFGVSLVERALIDGFCRATGVSFAEAVRTNTLGVRLGAIHAELDGIEPATLLPEQPLQTVLARHTIGLSDPLTDSDIPDVERLEDGLPQSLAACVDVYGLTHFKLKIGGDPDVDLPRLRQIADVIEQSGLHEYGFTLDGNEQYQRVEAFRSFWNTLIHEPSLSSFMKHLLFVEQPFHRDIALNAEVGDALNKWIDRPPIIIDESDGSLDSLPTALSYGYIGTSHKNCKGVFKGIANACLIEQRRRTEPDQPYTISGEDLANVGPVALLQDLAVMATLGIPHVERNGHHYFSGLSMLPNDLQEQVLDAHGDLYRHHKPETDDDFPTLNIQKGEISIGTVVQAPFGVALLLDPSQFTPVEDWRFDSL